MADLGFPGVGERGDLAINFFKMIFVHQWLLNFLQHYCLILIRNYLNSNWCKEEFSQGHLEAVEGRHRFLILVMVDDVNVGDLPDEMQKYVKTRTYIDAKDMEMLRKKLLYSMPQKPIKDYET